MMLFELRPSEEMEIQTKHNRERYYIQKLEVSSKTLNLDIRI